MALYNKYRPKTFDDMVGNETTINTLVSDLAKPDKPHAFLFVGPTGTGKTTLARIVASTLGAEGNDYREVDSADFRGIDTVREIRKQSQYMSLEGTCRIWLLDECHKMTNDAQNALLKALEDPPAHVYYILATTDPQKLIATIKGRCSQYVLTTLTDKQMFRLLRRVVKEEGQSLDQEVMDQIILDSQGHPRNALQILDQTLSVEPDQRLATAKRSAEIQNQTIDLCRSLIQKAGWKKVSSVLSGLKDEDHETIRRAVMGYCSAVLVKEDNSTAAVVLEQFKDNLYDSGFPGLVLAAYSAVKLT